MSTNYNPAHAGADKAHITPYKYSRGGETRNLDLSQGYAKSLLRLKENTLCHISTSFTHKYLF